MTVPALIAIAWGAGFVGAIAIASASSAAEFVPTYDQVRQVMSGCWAPLTPEEIGGAERPTSALDSTSIVCFDYDFGIKVQEATESSRWPSMQGGATYAFEDNRLVLKSAKAERSWFWARSVSGNDVSCDLHIRSDGIAILSGCLAADSPLDRVVIGRVAPKASGPATTVAEWSQLRGCWHIFDQEKIRSSAPGETSGWEYCFEHPSRATDMSYWSTSFDAWRSGNGDGEGYGGEYNYTLTKSRLVLRDDNNDPRLDCSARVVAGDRLILSDCGSSTDNGLYLWAAQ